MRRYFLGTSQVSGHTPNAWNQYRMRERDAASWNRLCRPRPNPRWTQFKFSPPRGNCKKEKGAAARADPGRPKPRCLEVELQGEPGDIADEGRVHGGILDFGHRRRGCFRRRRASRWHGATHRTLPPRPAAGRHCFVLTTSSVSPLVESRVGLSESQVYLDWALIRSETGMQRARVCGFS